MKYYIIAGEASGDLHASNLIKEIKENDQQAEFRCWGGDLMEAQGAKLVKHYRDLAFMGFAEVITNLRTILGNISFCKKDIVEYQPDAVILVDYPGFNLRIASFVKEQGIKVYYYISPQVWAWKKNRVKTIKKVVDRMFVILPFEKDFYKGWNYDVDFVGHPLLDAINGGSTFNRDAFIEKNQLDNSKPIIAMLPGSRKQEISKVLPIMLKAIDDFPDYQFIIGGAPALPESYLESYVGQKNVKIIYNQTHDLLRSAYAALVTSGTATLETALFGVPEVVCYKGSYISYQIAKRVISIDYISLVNLIMDKMVVKELIQGDLNYKNLVGELKKITVDEQGRANMMKDFDELHTKLKGGTASKTTAKLIVDDMKK
ncbi:MAG: lipid-A-disaccharide synthase [Hyphomicrobiales bacterium]